MADPRTGSLVEGTDPRLLVEVIEPAGGPDAAALRPVLLLHGFASSSQLNWHDSGWITALTAAGRRVLTVDLPGHGGSAAPQDRDSYRPSRIRADLLQILQDSGVLPLAEGNPASGLDILGYSLGSRLAWEFGATQPELVHRMVLGGPGSGDPLADFDLDAAREAAAGGAPVQDARTAELLRMAQLVPGNDLAALFRMIEAVKEEPFSPEAAVPAMPLLLVAGERDDLAATAPALAALSGQAELVTLPARTHANAVTSRAFKTAAVEFLAR
ncbi:alpha/beta fold hydrolase [Arthrobacter yangruifuii]|uniref:Alpha/beta fold hydrolase n=1 Tax=Arthrobacter yangruifuii TaxID=2606616 RepID=A0A5N6MDP0_9MICC|nr:alpha/beta fold hydrolase [Arthrobacter yangruifuii]KAD3436310.1 alpha/beta fold hydrolase [Arthrobacter yangruifuii]